MKMPRLFLSQAIMGYNTNPTKTILAQAYKEKGNLDKAIEVYEQLTDPNPENRNGRLIRPMYYYDLAALYEKKSRKAKAIETYEKFLALWKDADIGTAEIESAKNRLAVLKNQ